MFTWQKSAEEKENIGPKTLIQHAKAFKAHLHIYERKVVSVEVVWFRSPRVGDAGLQHGHAVHVYVATRDRFGALLGIGFGPWVSVALDVAAKHRTAPEVQVIADLCMDLLCMVLPIAFMRVWVFYPLVGGRNILSSLFRRYLPYLNWTTSWNKMSFGAVL